MQLIETGFMGSETTRRYFDGAMYKWFLGAQQCFSRWCAGDKFVAHVSVVYGASASSSYGYQAIEVAVYTLDRSQVRSLVLRSPNNAVKNSGDEREEGFVYVCTASIVGNFVFVTAYSVGVYVCYVIDATTGTVASGDYMPVGAPNTAGFYGSTSCAEWNEAGRHVVVSRESPFGGLKYDVWTETEGTLTSEHVRWQLEPWYYAQWLSSYTVDSSGIPNIQLKTVLPDPVDYLTVPATLRLTVNGVDIGSVPADNIQAYDSAAGGIVGFGPSVNWPNDNIVTTQTGYGTRVPLASQGANILVELYLKDMNWENNPPYSVLTIKKARSVGRGDFPFENNGLSPDDPTGQMDIFSPMIKLAGTLFFTTRRYGHPTVKLWAVTQDNSLVLRYVFNKRYFQVGHVSAVGDVLVVPVYESGVVCAYYSTDGSVWVKGHELMAGVALDVDPSFYDENNLLGSFVCPPYLPSVPVLQRVNRYLKRVPRADYGKIPIG